MSTRGPHGQILIITAASLLVLMAVAALVVDLGFSWMLHRQEQNAADPGSIAAARWLKDPSGKPRSPFPEAYDEACFYAKENGFFAGDTADCTAARASSRRSVWTTIASTLLGNRPLARSGDRPGAHEVPYYVVPVAALQADAAALGR